MALRPCAILQIAFQRSRLVPDPVALATVLEFGQLLIAVDERRRLLGLAVRDQSNGDILTAIVGKDEYGDWQRAQNEIQKARRARNRAAARGVAA